MRRRISLTTPLSYLPIALLLIGGVSLAAFARQKPDEVAKQLERLKSVSSAERRDAIEKLVDTEDPRAIEPIIAALKDALEILVVGPANAKTELRNFIAETAPDLARRIVGVESLDHPSDGQLIALARRLFTVLDKTIA